MIREIRLKDPPGILTYEERIVPFFVTWFYRASWTISWGPGLIDWLIRVATRPLQFEPDTGDDIEFAELIRRNLQR